MAQRPAEQLHVPVLLDRCLDLMAPALQEDGAVAVDATMGMGGHSEALLRRFPGVQLVAVDRDPQAHQLAGARLAPFGDRFHPVHTTYDRIPEALARHGLDRADAVLFDLGVSSLQLDERERGFAYSYDAPLDMRMDATAPVTAQDVVNDYSEADLRRILRDWGEERFAVRIARAIVERRAQAPLRTTGELVDVVRAAVPQGAQHRKGHPAKQTFQALRIEVNEELDVLRRAIPAALESVRVGGRVVVMSYHSLEDRIVKQAFAHGASSTAPKGFPVELEEHKPTLRILTRGAEAPTAQEIAENPRAASARLRAVERIRENAHQHAPQKAQRNRA
ncbi:MULTISPECIES: 16S rRNA (cytosine(1402)-N(4))-methyltransferase RsmH [Kocuria]|jgi:16S rRNA (cytosine1402-N4)-methyltransferase|uniref:16S rRNA (cytosine(1402)-N(4))-methyltransferase RsmH n=1 Tax=Kocuria TaxID=57493 RepID=UPI0020405B61|nr:MULTISPECIES: 16S rRNA (cytosine(1402)-N(4))-methyltransferase RsmH [Kocuria]MCM3688374.1 16S rRNA (cytosine(1402)-N(4))-methyltransferase RsmH [Kocuria rosea]HST72708.1 16S rRNA (cytosine(1402)-N(4))-methyltransferase RsmH [Kocuria rosea]